MTNRPALLKQIFTEARPYVEELVDLKDVFAGFRKLATDNGMDWGQIKALLKAEIEDARAEDGSKRVDRIVAKAEWASEYACLLGLGSAKMNENNFISELPPHDEITGELTEPVTDTRRETAGLTSQPEERGASGQSPMPSDGGEHDSRRVNPPTAGTDRHPILEPVAVDSVTVAPVEPSSHRRPDTTLAAAPGALLSDDPGPIPDFLRRCA